MLGNGKHSTVDYLDCYHSVGHISQLESLKYRAGSAAAFLFRIGPTVDSSPSLHSIKTITTTYPPVRVPPFFKFLSNFMK